MLYWRSRPSCHTWAAVLGLAIELRHQILVSVNNKRAYHFSVQVLKNRPNLDCIERKGEHVAL